jgi:hypothetical protein
MFSLVSELIAGNVEYLKAGNSLLVCPVQMLIEKPKLKLTTKSQIYKCQPEPLLMSANS